MDLFGDNTATQNPPVQQNNAFPKMNNFDGINLMELFNNKDSKGEFTAPEPPAAPAASSTQNTNNNTPPAQHQQNQPPVDPKNQVDMSKVTDLLGEFHKPNQPAPGEAGSSTPPLKADGTPDPFATTTGIIYKNYLEKGVLAEYAEFDGTEAGLDAAIAHTINERLAAGVDDYVATAFARVPPAQQEIAKNFIKHIAMGGDVTSFQTMNVDKGLPMEGLKSPDEAVALAAAKSITASFLKENGMSDALIQQQIKMFEAMGKDQFVNAATQFGTELNKRKENERQVSQQQLLDADNKRKADQKAFNEGVSKLVTDSSEVLGIKLDTKQTKDEMYRYGFVPTVELEDGRRITQYHADLMQMKNDPRFTFMQMALLKNKLNVAPALQEKATQQAATTLEQRLEAVQKNKVLNNGSMSNNASQQNKTTQQGQQEAASAFPFEDMDVMVLPSIR